MGSSDAVLQVWLCRDDISRNRVFFAWDATPTSAKTCMAAYQYHASVGDRQTAHLGEVNDASWTNAGTSLGDSHNKVQKRSSPVQICGG